MKRYIYYLLLFIQIYYSFSQSKITKGKVIDFITKKPIAFANISFDQNKFNGTVTDIDGLFYLDTSKKLKTITISYLGYQTKTLKINEIKNSIIELKQLSYQLDEVEIVSKENKAKSIIRKVIKNRIINNPKNINAFTFISYNKVVFDNLKSNENDSIKNLFSDKHIFITETVSKRKYLYPNFAEDIIIGTKASGFNSPTFSILATNVQPFSFYDNIITINNINYINPISKGSFKRYKFKYEDEFYTKNDTVFIISFKPKKGKNFNALKGVLYINSNKYAIQNIDATPFENKKLIIKIQQQYKLINNYWFPEQLNFELKNRDSIYGFNASGKSYIYNVKLNPKLTKKEFSIATIKTNKDATKKDSTFWNLHRHKKLNKTERTTYKFMDSIGKIYHFDNKLKIVNGMFENKLKFKYFNLDLDKLFWYNKYEHYRFGAGFHTSEKILKNISIGTFAGYGTKDKKWKYGFEIATKIPSNNQIEFTLQYRNTLREIGKNNMDKSTNFKDLRNFIAYKMDKIEQYKFSSFLKFSKNIDWKIHFDNTNILPLYDYSFNNEQQNFTNTEVSVKTTYALHEKIVSLVDKQYVKLPTNFPVFSFTFSRGLKNILNGKYNYNKYELSVTQRFVSKTIGVLNYKINAGYIDTPLPISLLFTGNGSLDKDIPLIMNGYFQTISPYQFVSDSFINIFKSHNFGSLLLKAKYFAPEIILHNNLGYGTLSNKEIHHEFSFKTMDKLFLETGIELQNIIKLNYLNIGTLGFGFAFFYKYGFYSSSKIKDNMYFKFDLKFNIE